jgi:hypothetical protein
MVPSAKYAARRGSVEARMRMLTACFARALQRWTSRICVRFLLTFQEVRPISKTRNQLVDIDGNNVLSLKALGVAISTFETLPRIVGVEHLAGELLFQGFSPAVSLRLLSQKF